jgi:hypothetical protein
MAPTFLIGSMDGGEWSASRLGRFTPGKNAHGSDWIGGWVGPRAGWTLWRREKSLVPEGNRTQAVQRVAIPTELSRLKSPRYPLDRVGGPQTCLGIAEKRNISNSCMEWNPDFLAV